MKHSTIDDIKVVQSSYEEIYDRIGYDKIEQKIKMLKECFENFIYNTYLDKKVYLNQYLLKVVVLDYYVDTLRIRDFHPIDRTNIYKRIAYMTYWFVKRKPIQFFPDANNVEFNINEKFITTYIIDELLVNYNETLQAENLKFF